MKIRIGTLAKENNSTKRIDVSGTTTTGFTNMDVQLKDNVSIHSPVIKIDNDSYNPSWNYVYIELWNRFYFIRESVIVPGGVWEVQLIEDVLATWKTEIAASTCYVSRSASHGSDYLPDSTWSHDTNIYTKATTIDLTLDGTGIFLLYVASDDTSNQGIPGCTVYAVTIAELSDLMNYLFSSAFFDSATGDITDTSTKALAKTFFNPFQYILRCMWIPMPLTLIGHEASAPMHFGWWTADDSQHSITYDGCKVKSSTYITEKSFTLETYTSWIDRDPTWSKYDLYLPGCGTVSIPSDYAGQTLKLKMYVDLATGAVCYFLRDNLNTIISSAMGQLGCDVQLSSLYKDFINQGATGLIGTAVRSAFAGAVTGVHKMLANYKPDFSMSLASDLNATKDLVSNSVTGTQAAMQPTASSVGSNGVRSILQYEYQAIVSISKYHRYEDIHVPLGKACNKVLQLGNLSGYTECVNPKVDIPGNSEESAAINSFLTTGFYME